MRIQPLVFLEQLTDEQIREHEGSDRLWVSRREFERLLTESEPGVTTILRLINQVGQSVVGAVYSIHQNEDADTIYAPQWMCSLLELEDTISMERCEPSLCSRIVLQPHTSEHVSADEPLELLNHAFERYTCITSGTTIPLWLDSLSQSVQATVVGMLPETSATLCIRGSELELELLRPLDMPEEEEEEEEEQEKQGPAGAAEQNVVTHIEPEATRETVVPETLSPAELRRRMYEAALKRLKAAEGI